jgi:lipoprotein-releasing system permease protein
VAFFLAVSSLMRGSERDFIKRLIDNSPHITVSDEYRNPQGSRRASWPDGAVEVRRVKPLPEVRGLRGHAQKLAFIESLPGLRAAPVLVGSVVLTFAGRNEGVTLSGIIPAKMKGVSTIEEKLIKARWTRWPPIRTASDRRWAGEKVRPEHGQRGECRVAGGRGPHPESGRHLPHRQCQLRRNPDLCAAQAGARDAGSAQPGEPLHLQLDDPYAAREVAGVIERQVGYKAVSWLEASQDLMSVLLVRNLIMYSVVSAILVVAAFGIYNTISTIVMEKIHDIAILKSMGFHARDIRRIFLAEGDSAGADGQPAGLDFWDWA